jgi:hypothetical protein
MPDEEPVTRSDAPPAGDATTRGADAAAQPTAAYLAADERDEWPDEPGELPPRPRRRVLGPIPLALLGVLLVACGFIAGVLVEKGQTSSSSSSTGASSIASRFAALRRGASGPSGAPGAGAFGGAGATVGSVAYVSGNTLYVTTAEGATVKVTTSAGTTVTKTVKAAVKGIHPGEIVTVTGAGGSNGAISAESIRVGSGAGGGLGALFGGSGGGTGGGSASGGGGGGGEPTLFGRGR